MYFIRLLILIGMGLFAIELHSAPVKNVNGSNVYGENQLVITITKDKPEFTILLKSNPTTGYSWFLREYDKDLLRPVNHVLEKPKHGEMGEPGAERWTFRATPAAFIVPQQTMIRFIYARPWEINTQPKNVVFRVSSM